MSGESFHKIGLEQLPEVAASIVKCIEGIRVLAFYGEMGAGKTTLIKAICNCLSVEDEVSSPTFSLVNEYHSPKYASVYHFDFYRISDESEALDMGIEEYLYSGNYCLIEWPENIPSLLPDNHAEVHITVENNKRTINLIIS